MVNPGYLLEFQQATELVINRSCTTITLFSKGVNPAKITQEVCPFYKNENFRLKQILSVNQHHICQSSTKL